MALLVQLLDTLGVMTGRGFKGASEKLEMFCIFLWVLDTWACPLWKLWSNTLYAYYINLKISMILTKKGWAKLKPKLGLEDQIKEKNSSCIEQRDEIMMGMKQRRDVETYPGGIPHMPIKRTNSRRIKRNWRRKDTMYPAFSDEWLF